MPPPSRAWIKMLVHLSAQVLKQECKQSTIVTVTCRPPSAQDLSLYFDKFIVHPPNCDLSPSPPPPPPRHDALRRQVLRDCSQGSEIAEVGRPQDLLADASSSCVQRAACLLRALTAALFQVELGGCAKPGAIARVQWMGCVKK